MTSQYSSSMYSWWWVACVSSLLWVLYCWVAGPLGIYLNCLPVVECHFLGSILWRCAVLCCILLLCPCPCCCSYLQLIDFCQYLSFSCISSSAHLLFLLLWPPAILEMTILPTFVAFFISCGTLLLQVWRCCSTAVAVLCVLWLLSSAADPFLLHLPLPYVAHLHLGFRIWWLLQWLHSAFALC